MSTEFEQITELSAVNDMIGLLGELPVADLEDAGPLGDAALRLLRHTAATLQAKGCYFNEETLTLTPDTETARIVLQGDCITVDATNKTAQVTQRGAYLYDLKNNTYDFSGSVQVDYVRFIPFADLPRVAAYYFASAAALGFCSLYDADRLKVEMAQAMYESAKRQFNAEDLRQRDTNFLRRPGHVQRMHFVKQNRWSR